MKSRILLGVGAAACFLFVIGVSPAFGECPGVEICEYWLGSGFIAVDSYCVGPDCFDMNYGAELRVVAVDDEGLFPKTWHVWAAGEVIDNNIEYQCEQIKPVGNHVKVVLPEELHCAFWLQTENHLYLELFASNPEIDCLGWISCEAAN